MKTIEQQNAMIAEFMGGKLKTQALPIMGSRMHHYDIWLPIHGICIIKQLKYHTSWDWLIPVINKIHSLDEFYKYKDNSGQFERDEIVNTKYIEVTHSNVCQFIEWYNANK